MIFLIYRPIPEEIKADDKIGNPIGWLQEMCMSRRWPPPLYEMENEEGLPHERQFTIACEVFKHREVGTGKSKKLAKRKAALKMWQHLQELPMEGNSAPQGLDDDDEVSIFHSCLKRIVKIDSVDKCH